MDNSSSVNRYRETIIKACEYYDLPRSPEDLANLFADLANTAISSFTKPKITPPQSYKVMTNKIRRAGIQPGCINPTRRP